MRTLVTLVGPLATAAATSVALSQTVTAAGPLAVNGTGASGGVVAFANPARAVIAGGDAGAVYRVEGRDRNGRSFGETLTGAGTTINLFAAVTAVYCDRAMVAAVTVGNDNGGASEPIRLDEWADPPIGCQVVVSGTVNFSVVTSMDDPNDPISPIAWGSMFWDTSLCPAGAINGTASLSFSIATAPLWMRLLLNSGTGSARLTVSQFNVVEV